MMGVTLSAGGSLQWFRNALCETVAALAKRRKIDVYDVLTEEAAVTPPGAEGLFFLPYLAGERTPHADPLTRGAFVGLTLRHSRGHLVRAITGRRYVFAARLPGDHGRAARRRETNSRTGGGAKESVLATDAGGCAWQNSGLDGGRRRARVWSRLVSRGRRGEFKNIAEACDATVKTKGQVKPVAASRRLYDKAFPVYQRLYHSLRDDFRGCGPLLKAERACASAH